MAEESLASTSLAWKQIASDWKTYFASPSRISPQELGKYKGWLAQINGDRKPLKALVLGATPELRDALFELGYRAYSIDINWEMILAMNDLLRTKNPNEVVIKANWLDNPLAGDYFDVVIGDAVLPNLPWNERTNLLAEVKRLLKPNGVFLTRAFCVPDRKPFASVDEIFGHFSKKEPTMQSALEMALELQLLAYDPKDHLGSFAKAKQLLEEYHGRKGSKFGNQNLQKTHDVVWDFWCRKFVSKVFTYAYRREEEADYGKYFNIGGTFEAGDHDYSKITPMYVLKVLKS